MCEMTTKTIKTVVMQLYSEQEKMSYQWQIQNAAMTYNKIIY